MAAGVEHWYALEVLIEPEAREAIEYSLMEAGALGTQFESAADLGRVTAYFSALPQREQIREAVAEGLRIYNLATSSVREMQVQTIENRDWMAEWKNGWQPVVVGSRFLVAPPWAEVPDSKRIVIRIEPGMAFGTGTHETTRLCLRAIEQYFAGGSFLDVGTGTGILAIAAAKLFPGSSITAIDTDLEAIRIAEENAALNDVAGINFSHASVSETTASVDFVCANLTAPVILELLPRLVGATCGRLVLSGLLDTQVESITARLMEFGVQEVLETLQDGEWVAMIV
jgi:ribosomal protein L11 methyltransferase